MEVCKEITISTAHLLSGHKGRCKNLHGHNYRVCVSVFGKQLDDSLTDARMVLDFGDLKTAIAQEIDEAFDHAIVFSSEPYRGQPEIELLEWATKWNMRCVVMPDGMRSTAEDMAKVMATTLCNRLGLPVKVTLWETPTSYAVAEVGQ